MIADLLWGGTAPGRFALTIAEPKHPDVEQLRAFAAGSIGDHELARLAAHLDGCARCRAWWTGS